MRFAVRTAKPKLLPRTQPVRWRERHPDAVIWLLIAGPGSGKTAAAWQIAEQLGRPLVYLEAHTGPRPDDLANMLGSGSKGSGQDLARRLREYLDRVHPDGATIVFDAVERILADATAGKFLESWLLQGESPHRTLLASRRPLPFHHSRRIATGEIAVLRRSDLWLAADEVGRWTEGTAPDLDLVEQLAGWPLGIRGLANGFGSVDAKGDSPRRFVEDLANQELVAALPNDLRMSMRRVSAMPLFDPEVLDRLWPQDGWLTLGEQLAEWGLLCKQPTGHYAWFPPARQAIRKLWEESALAPQRREVLADLTAAWVACDPLAALALGVEHEAWEQALVALEGLRALLHRE
ncbi:MAG: ATP-binding protein, partial [Cyanobacteria bacterium REEB65]|nr:ATP-binding protein [Cyanobacteria bacterium REEB65]